MENKISMLLSHLKLALRSLFRYKMHSLISVLGLAVGFACFIIVFVFIAHEMSYDAFHENVERLYRIRSDTIEKQTGTRSSYDGYYGIVFGGQFREIARLIHGTDPFNMRLIEERYRFLLYRFIDELQHENRDIVLPDLDNFFEKFHIFGLENPDDPSSEQPWRLEGFNADYGDFSTQNAINCVYWLVELMVRVQEFGDSMPTVGGDIHLAIIDRKDGFRFISEEAYKLQGHITPR